MPQGTRWDAYGWRSPNSTTLLSNTYNEIYQATYGDTPDSSVGLPLLEAYVDDPTDYSLPQGSWGHVITALAFAVDQGPTNAALVTGA